MLVLTRRANESVLIGEDIKVTVLGVKGNQVRVGVTAPKEVPVHREEIYFQILEEQGLVTPGDPTRVNPATHEMRPAPRRPRRRR